MGARDASLLPHSSPNAVCPRRNSPHARRASPCFLQLETLLNCNDSPSRSKDFGKRRRGSRDTHGTHTGRTGAHGHTVHTDKPHNHPNPPSTNAHTKPHIHDRIRGRLSHRTPEPTEPPWGRVGHTYVHKHSVEALVLGGPEVVRVVLNSSQRISATSLSIRDIQYVVL